jgi:trimeric autotransporter adhesin
MRPLRCFLCVACSIFPSFLPFRISSAHQDIQAPPSLSSLFPSSATAGGQGFSLLVNGDNFNMSSVVQWNGANRATSYMNRTQLSAMISADDISSAATVNVTVSNPFPVGTVSSPLSFRVNNPLPMINALNPGSAVAAGQSFTLTVSGMDLVPGCTVQWNGLSRATSFIDRTRVTAAISASDIAGSGQTHVSVSNPGPGGGTSGAIQFNIENPVPSISYVYPNSAVAGTTGISLMINGAGFIDSSVVQWNGSRQNTLFVSPSSLTISIGASQIASAGKSSISVVNPAPGGGKESGHPPFFRVIVFAEGKKNVDIHYFELK